MSRCGTSGYGLVGMVVLGGWLDLMILEVFCLMILEVFSNLNDSVITFSALADWRSRSQGKACKFGSLLC